MRKIRIIEQISLDGVIQAPGGRDEGGDDYAHGGWTAPYRNTAMGEAVTEAQGRSFDLLLGRRTYDIFAGYWPKAGNGPIANGLNAATKYVATHRPDSLGWGPVEDLGADIMEGVRGVKSKDGPDLIVWGSSTLTSVLLEQGLVDEVLLLVYPVLLGRGKRFFSDSADPRELTLVSTKVVSSGVLMNTYRYVGSLRTESFADTIQMTTPHAFLDALASSQRSAELADADDIFGFLIGSWEVDAVLYDETGQTQNRCGEVHASWVLEGRAIQDLFIFPRRADRISGIAAPGDRYGTTIRTYDRKLRAWRVNFINPAADETSAQLTARRKGHGIEMEGKLSDGTPIRWRYVTIQPASFHYTAEELSSHDKSWHLYLELFGKRLTL